MVKEKVRSAVKSTYHSTRKLGREFRRQWTTALIAAFGFLLALTWNDFVKSTTDSLISDLGLIRDSIGGNFLIAVIITLAAIIGIMIFSKLKPIDEVVEVKK